MPYYELLCLASGHLARRELRDVIHKTCRIFMDQGGVVTRINPLSAYGQGPRKLAYDIRLNQVTYKTGFFVNVCAFASPATLAEVERQLKIDERILRTMPIRKRTMDAVLPVPDMDQGMAPEKTFNPNDPDLALRQFMREFEREFPDGKMRLLADDGMGAARARRREGNMTSDFDAGMGKGLKGFKESNTSNVQSSDPGLAWLTNAQEKRDGPPTPEGS